MVLQSEFVPLCMNMLFHFNGISHMSLLSVDGLLPNKARHHIPSSNTYWKKRKNREKERRTERKKEQETKTYSSDNWMKLTFSALKKSSCFCSWDFASFEDVDVAVIVTG